MKNVDLAVKELKKEFKLKGVPGLREIKNIISKMGYTLLTYESSEDLLKELKLTEQAKHYPSVSCTKGKKSYTFYRGAVHSDDLPFILCHEIGHIYMNHINQTNGYFDTSDHKEEEANVFATRLLYPQKQEKSKVSKILTLATLLLPLFAFLVVGTGFIDGFQLPVKTSTTSEPAIVVPEQTSENSEFIDKLIIQVENATASPKTAVPTQSAQASGEQTALQHTNVVVTRTGTKYHKPDCSYVKHKTNTKRYTLAEAESNYYAPCSRCF